MSEELKKIREALEKAQGLFDRIAAECQTPACISFAERDETRQALIIALARLEAREAEAPKDARELANRIGATIKQGIRDSDCDYYGAYGEAVDQAAAEIERYVQSRIAEIEKDRDEWKAEAARYARLWCNTCTERDNLAAAPKTVSMEMLDIVASMALEHDGYSYSTLSDIAARYGYEVIE